ncbi:MAG TPA: discoidin domain-containing protein [Pleomorphomonadaceae bacterium]|nr:discoidin domain-containing protein [Pleomorphomonadaceae bacterium]
MGARLSVLVLLAVVLAACAEPPTTSPSPSGTPSWSPPPASASPTPVATPPDLSARPLIWFAPLPPLFSFTGSEDFIDLFETDADWQLAASRIGVFKLYGGWVVNEATDQELRTVVHEIARRGMVLAVEMGPLDPSATCGSGVESFAGIDEGLRISRRIQQAGGTIQIIAMDEPYYYAHLYSGPNACHWPLDRVATAVVGFRDAMRAEWPGIILGDIEPMPAPVSPDGLAAWLDAYEAAGGEPLPFLHMDMDWARSNWPALGVAVENAGSSRGVPIGIIYNGGAATSDALWLAMAGRRVIAYEADAGGRPDHVIFQSWMDKPDHVLPESDPATFTSLVNRYFDDRASLGELAADTGNLALEKPATASSAYGDATADRTVDGDADTLWNAGGFAPAWIEIDLGSAQPVAAIRLLVQQTPSGTTHHRVTCAPAPDMAATLLSDVVGETASLQVLTVTLDPAVSCRIIRIETVSSPSWVAWREIEVIGVP